MHELGIVFEIVKTVEKIALEEKLTEIQSVVLEVGELSLIVPDYLKECWPAAIDGSKLMKATTLEIEVVAGNAECNNCKKIFNVVANNGFCPDCHCFEKELLSGREFIIKEILAC